MREMWGWVPSTIDDGRVGKPRMRFGQCNQAITAFYNRHDDLYPVINAADGRLSALGHVCPAAHCPGHRRWIQHPP